MNPYEFFRTRVGAMISHGFAVDTVRTNLDLKGASEVWGGPDMDDCAAWYFWLATAPGAYRLRLALAAADDDSQGNALRGIFSVSYYPYRYEPVYRHFSRRERELIESGAFDETNTPRADALGEISDDLFGVGSIEFTHDPGCGQTFLIYSGLDRMRIQGTASVFRDVPAWDVGYPLFDAIAGLEAFLGRLRPKRVVLSRQPGFEFVETADGRLEDRDSSDAEFKSLLVAFHPERPGARSAVKDRITARHTAEPWTPLVDSTATAHCGHGRSHGHAHDHGACTCGPGDGHAPADVPHTVRLDEIVGSIPLAFNEQWWAMADADQTVPTMPCGCH